MISINSSAASLAAQKALANNRAALDKTIAQLSSGLRITQAGDDAAGLGVATRLSSQARSSAVAERNANDGISAIQSADAAVSTQGDLVGRLRELAMQSANGSLTSADRASIEKERTALTAEIDRVAGSTSFNGSPLLSGGGNTSLTLQVGLDASPSDTIKVTFGDTTAQSLGIAGARLDTAAGARASLSAFDTAIESLSSTRAALGATQNRLESAIRTAGAAAQNLAEGSSRIMDADLASAAAAMMGNKIRIQAGIAVLAQANKLPGAALSLLR
jgi:flagellin